MVSLWVYLPIFSSVSNSQLDCYPFVTERYDVLTKTTPTILVCGATVAKYYIPDSLQIMIINKNRCHVVVKAERTMEEADSVDPGT